MTGKGLILLGHGSRDPLWREPMERLATQAAAGAPGLWVRCAYLELCGPDLESVVADAASAGLSHARVLPVFLGVGRHAREDVPPMVAALRAAHPALQIELVPAVGEDPRLLAALTAIALDGL